MHQELIDRIGALTIEIHKEGMGEAYVKAQTERLYFLQHLYDAMYNNHYNK